MNRLERVTTAALRGSGRLAAALLLLSMGVFAGTKGPDAGGYTVTDETVYSFVDISSTGTGVLAGADDRKAEIAIGFGFVFYGRTYTSACVSDNGLLTFGACQAIVDFSNQDLTAAPVPGGVPAIAPLWQDFSFQVEGAGAVHYQTLGTAPNRQFVVQWTSASAMGTGTPLTFQVILYEGSNEILMQYRNLDAGAGHPATNGALATVGIQDANGNATGKRLQWSHNAGVLASGKALKFAASAAPTSVAITVATAPAGRQISVDNVIYTAPKSFDWTPGSTHRLTAPSPQTETGTTHTFNNWSNGGVQDQKITAPASVTTYTATFLTTYTLTVRSNPVAGGTVSGGGGYQAGTSATVTATPARGYKFTSFSGALTGTTNPQPLVMDGPKTVTASFAALVPTLLANVQSKTGTAAARVWTIKLTNAGVGAANNSEITAVKFTQNAGAACSPGLATTLPAAVGSLAPGAAGSTPITINFSGCETAARFSVKVDFRANGGAYTGSTTVNNQYQ